MFKYEKSSLNDDKFITEQKESDIRFAISKDRTDVIVTVDNKDLHFWIDKQLYPLDVELFAKGMIFCYERYINKAICDTIGSDTDVHRR